MKKASFIGLILVTALASCKKSTKADNSDPNVEVTATSFGTFTIKIFQASPQLHQTYNDTEPGQSNYDKKLLYHNGDGIQVQVTNATSNVHLVIKVQGEVLEDKTTPLDIDFEFP